MRNGTITPASKEYPLRFSLRVVKTCTERYGSRIFQAIQGKGSEVGAVDECLWLLAAMLDAGWRCVGSDGGADGFGGGHCWGPRPDRGGGSELSLSWFMWYGLAIGLTRTETLDLPYGELMDLVAIHQIKCEEPSYAAPSLTGISSQMYCDWSGMLCVPRQPRIETANPS